MRVTYNLDQGACETIISPMLFQQTPEQIQPKFIDIRKQAEAAGGELTIHMDESSF